MTPPKFIVHLLSGGLDSTVMLYDLVGQQCKVHCLLFEYGQRHVQELIFAKGHCRRLNVPFTTLSIPQLLGSELTDGTGSVVVPFRNPIMLSLAVNFAAAIGADCVTIGCNLDDKAFPDCRWEVMDALNHAIKLSRLTIEICAPYIQKRKWEIGGLGQELGVQLWDTWSCYKGGDKPCGECDACKKRQFALAPA